MPMLGVHKNLQVTQKASPFFAKKQNRKNGLPKYASEAGVKCYCSYAAYALYYGFKNVIKPRDTTCSVN